MPAAHPAPQDPFAPSHPDVSLPRPGCIEIVFHGHVERDQVSAALTRARALLQGEKARIFIPDCRDVTGYSFNLQDTTITLLRYLRSRGVNDIIGVMPNSAIAAFASVMARISGYNAVFYRTAAETWHVVDGIHSNS